MTELHNFDAFDRDEWKTFHGKNEESIQTITEDDLKEIKSIEDKVSLSDVREVYAPIRYLINLLFKNYQAYIKTKAEFMHRQPNKTPFIIGISGSVAVGKSTTARLLSLMLERYYPQYKTYNMTTDGFLYPNKVLKEKGIEDRKGFPESYDMEKLINFLDDVKANKGPVKYPKYSHDKYDVVEGEYDEVDNPDILIVEGINVLQSQTNDSIYVSDYFDFSIYIDADAKDIKKWFLHRFETFLDAAKDDEKSYYHQFTTWKREEAMKLAEETWENVNYKNLKEYIEPTRGRADLIIHKASNHEIDKLYLRKY